MAASDALVNQLTHSQELLNRELSVHQETLSNLQKYKIAGEGAASDKSFALQHEANLNQLEINKLQVAINKAKDEGRLKDAMALSVQKKKLEKKNEEINAEKAVVDLQTTVDYEQQKRDLEKLLDPLSQQEMQYGDLVNAIKTEMGAIDDKKAKLKDIENQLNVERDKQWLLKVEYDNSAKTVDYYSGRIEEMAKNFLSRYDEMIAKQDELNKKMASSPNPSMLSYQNQTNTMARDFLDHYKNMIAAQGDLNRSMAIAGTGTRAVDMNRVLVGAGVSQMATTSQSTTTIIHQHFDKLILPNVTDYKSLKRELGKDAKLRLAVPS
jgi:hypothetical protein